MKTAESRSVPAILASLLLGLSACSPAVPEGGAASQADLRIVPTTLAELDPARLAERADPSDFCSLDTVDGQLFVQDPINRVANPAAVRFTGGVGDAGSLSRPVSPVLRNASAGEYNLALGYLSSGRTVLCDNGRRVVVGG